MKNLIFQYYKTFAVALAAMEKKYGSLAEVALALSKNRVMANAGAPVELRMQAFDCHAFLGRARQSLCPAAKAFKVCVAYVNEGKWDLCALAGNPGLYSAGEALNRQLRNSGCIPYIARGVSSGPFSFSSAMTAQCLAARARAACDVFRKGKSAVVCQGPQEIASFDARRYRGRPPLLQPVPGLRPVPVEPAPPPGRMPGEERMPAAPQPMTRAVAPQPSLLPPPATPQVQKSTLCRFTSGPRRGETQDYAPMAPIPVGSSCQDARGSFGTVVAR